MNEKGLIRLGGLWLVSYLAVSGSCSSGCAPAFARDCSSLSLPLTVNHLCSVFPQPLSLMNLILLVCASQPHSHSLSLSLSLCQAQLCRIEVKVIDGQGSRI